MAINFASGILATSIEQRTYNNLKALNKTELNSDADMYSSEEKVSFEKGSLEKLWCPTKYFGPFRQFRCYDPKTPLGSDNPKYMINWAIPPDVKVTEVRYGDIDRDGDIDIAVKLTDGAIYVFHNLSK